MSKNAFPTFIFIFIVLVVVFNDFSFQDYFPKSYEAKDLYSLRATENTWPKLEEGAEALSENLLASNYYIVLDGSGSMSDEQCSDGSTKLKVAKRALDTFSKQIPVDANIGLYTFDASGKGQRLALARNNQSRFAQSVYDTSASGGTPLYSAISFAYGALSEQANKQLGYGEYHLVVVTDGKASNNQNPREIVSEILASSPVLIHTIGFCIDDDHTLNQPGYTYYKSANNPKSLQTGLASVLAESPNFDVDTFSE